MPEDLDALCAALLVARPGAAADAASASRAARRRAAAARRRRHAPAARAAAAADAGREFVGREAELGALRDAFAATRRRASARGAFVTGESGMGKSALVRAFLDELRVQGRAVVLAGRCYEREAVPYKAFDRVVDALTRYLRAAARPRDRRR